MSSLSASSTQHKTGDIAVSVKNLSLTYTTAIVRKPTLKARAKALGRGTKQTRVVQALENVNLDVAYGQVLGVIGTNGAGKSSLMRTIAGRANVHLGGLAAGMSRKEIEDHFEEIAEFSELGDAIDAPMSTYSSGMYARLGFSVAATVQPDILIVDEALSTGDAHFKEKSFNKIKELRSEDRALILVSHAMGTLREICNDVAWLHKGKLVNRGEPNQIIDAYQDFLHLGKSSVIDEDL